MGACGSKYLAERSPQPKGASLLLAGNQGVPLEY